MTINSVVVDSAKLPEGVGFPPLGTAKTAWEQYLCKRISKAINHYILNFENKGVVS